MFNANPETAVANWCVRISSVSTISADLRLSTKSLKRNKLSSAAQTTMCCRGNFQGDRRNRRRCWTSSFTAGVTDKRGDKFARQKFGPLVRHVSGGANTGAGVGAVTAR